MNPLTDARGIVAAALAGVGVPVQPLQPQTGTLPAVTLVPGAPWYDQRGRVALDVVARVSAAAGPDALTGLEDLMWKVREAIATDARIAWEGVNPPELVNDNTIIAASVPVSVRP
jgi:hypothetical protein